MSLYDIFVNGLGLIGNVLFGVGCVPTAYRACRDGETQFPRDTAWIIGVACLAFYAYLGLYYGFTLLTGPLGIVETVSYALVLRYSYFPRPRAGYRGYNLFCTREDDHEGPCNGIPRHTCPGYAEFEQTMLR